MSTQQFSMYVATSDTSAKCTALTMEPFERQICCNCVDFLKNLFNSFTYQLLSSILSRFLIQVYFHNILVLQMQ